MLYSVFFVRAQIGQKMGGSIWTPPPGTPRLAKTLVLEGLKRKGLYDKITFLKSYKISIGDLTDLV